MAKRKKHSEPSPRRLSSTQRSSLLLMPMLLLIWCVAYYLLGGEIIAVNKGFGWDGYNYGMFAWQFYKLLDTPVLDPYLAQRVLPSAIIHYAMRLFAIPLNYSNVLQGFIVLNTVCITAAGWFWAATMQRLQVSLRMQWLGFIGVFGNLALLKMSLYYPPLTDIPAFFLTILALYCYLHGFTIALYVTAAIAYFTFPTGFYITALLILLPYAPLVQESAESRNLLNTLQRRLALTGTVLTIIIAGVSLTYFAVIQKVSFPGVESIFQPTLAFSIPLMLAYLGAIAWIVFSSTPWQRLGAILRERSFAVRGAAVIGMWGVLMLLRIKFLQSPDPRITPPMNVNLFFAGSLSLSIAKPLLPFISHVVYFSPLIVIAAFSFRSLYQASFIHLGFGYAAVVAITALMSSIMSESRQLINLMPFIMLGVVLIGKELHIQRWHLGLFAILGIMFSKIWLTFNYPDMAEKGFGSISLFPAQWYFMNHGPWMAMTGYLWQAGIILVVSIALWFMFPRFRR